MRCICTVYDRNNVVDVSIEIILWVYKKSRKFALGEELFAIRSAEVGSME